MDEGDLPHPEDIRDAIAALYAGAALLWVLIAGGVAAAERTPAPLLTAAAFALPLLLLWGNSADLRNADEHAMTEYGALAISLVTAITILTYISKNFGRKHPVVLYLVYASIFVILLSVPDYYFGHRWLPLTVHIRAVLQIFAVGHLALAVTVICVAGPVAAANPDK